MPTGPVTHGKAWVEMVHRYLATGVGSLRYPLTAVKRRSSGTTAPGAKSAVSTSIKEGGDQIEYEDQDPRIHRKWLEAIRASGVKSEMGDIFDEPKILALPADALSGVIRLPLTATPSAPALNSRFTTSWTSWKSAR